MERDKPGRPTKEPKDPDLVKKREAVLATKGTIIKRIVGPDGRGYISRRF